MADKTAGTAAAVPDIPPFVESSWKRDAHILKQLVGRDFTRKYRRSFLGVAWSVLNPLLMMLVMSFVFSFFLRYAEIPHYPLYLIIGNIVWGVLSESTGAGVTSIIDSASLLKKVRIDKFVFPVERALFSLVNFAFSLIAAAIVMVWEGVMPTPWLLLVPVFVALLFLFCCGLCLLLSALAVFFRDVIHLWGVVLTAWMYATPIFYPVTMIQDVPFRIVQKLMYANPMFNYITCMRSLVIDGAMPGDRNVMLCVAWAVVSMLLGWLVFRKAQRKFVLHI